MLPSIRRDDKRGVPQRGDERLRAAMAFDLVGDGRLIAVGTIRPGTAKAFAAEIAKRGGYVKTVVLHSPGGSVGDALEMGRLIRQKNFSTEVENGGYCASSCPLVFAGGVERRAGDGAAIGVHQVTTFAINGVAPTADKGMDSVQRVPPNARNTCSRWASIRWSGSTPWKPPRTSCSISSPTSSYGSSSRPARRMRARPRPRPHPRNLELPPHSGTDDLVGCPARRKVA